MLVTDFISFWSKCDKQTSSLDSGRYFAHYVAASNNPAFTVLHVCSQIAPWQSGLTSLLEKVKGNILMDKLWAICLLEEFHWWLKTIFAWQVMMEVKTWGMLLLEQFAAKGKTVMDVVLLKEFEVYNWTDIFHLNCALNSIDAHQCYDKVNHSIASITFQAHGLPKQHVCLYLCTKQSLPSQNRLGQR